MNKWIRLAVATSLMTGFLPAQAVLLVDNYPPTAAIQPVGEFDTAYYGQTFTGVSGKAGDLTFRITHTDGADAIDFHVLLTQLVGGDANSLNARPDINNILFESGLVSVGPGGGAQDITVDLGGVKLNAATSYAWIIDAFVEFDGIEGTGNMGSRAGLPDGHFFFHNVVGVGDRAAHFAAEWSDFLNNDLAYQLKAVPEPSTLALLGLSLLGLGVGFRRKQA